MKSITNYIKFLALFALILNLKTASALTQSQPAIPDPEIINEIQLKIQAEKLLSDIDINIHSKDGIVTLIGTVETDQEASKLIEVANSTLGVQDVETAKLHVKKSREPLIDSNITAKVKGAFIREKLFGEKNISVMSIHVETTDGVVHLSGTANTKKEAENAVKIAKKIKGVKEVKSKIEYNGGE